MSIIKPLCTILLGTAIACIPAQSFADDSVQYAVVIENGSISGHRPPLTPYPGGAGYILNHDYQVTIDGFTFVISKGFLFDGASVPKSCWVFMGSPFDSDLMLAALIHDWLYWSRSLPKDTADTYFKIVLRADKVGFFRAGTMHRAVWAFGGKAYDSNIDVVEGSTWHIEMDEIVMQ